MNVLFLILWTAISPGCVGLIYTFLTLVPKLSWHPGSSHLGLSIAVYLVYWLVLASLQSLLLFGKFRNKQFAYRWFFTTSITGFLLMLSHDLTLAGLGIDTRGQGALILILSLPILGLVGGSILGLAQYFVIRKFYRSNLKLTFLNGSWFAIAFLSWAIGFGGILAGNYIIPVTVLLTAAGGAMKGWFIQKYLKMST